MKILKKVIDLLKQTFHEWQEDNASLLAASLAYYTIFSLAPLLILAITIAGIILNRSAVETQILAQAQSFIGKNGADFIKTLMENVSINLDKGIIASIVGLAALVFGAINIFRVLRNTLNTIWDVRVEEQKGFWKSLKSVLLENALSFAMVMGLGLILLVSFLLNTGLSALNGVLSNVYFIPEFVISFLNFVVTLAIITIVLAILFKFLPETEVAWSDVLLGCLVTSVLFILGNFAISLYLGNSSIGVTFGAAGSLAVFLIWIYYSAQIIFFGAEFTQVYANRYGSKIRASAGARIIASDSGQFGLSDFSKTRKIEKYIPNPEISYNVRSAAKVFQTDNLASRPKQYSFGNRKFVFTLLVILSVLLLIQNFYTFINHAIKKDY